MSANPRNLQLRVGRTQSENLKGVLRIYIVSRCVKKVFFLSILLSVELIRYLMKDV